MEQPFIEQPKITEEYNKDEFRVENFDITEELKKIEAPFVELGGPTHTGYKLVNAENLGKKIYVSNIEKGAPRWDSYTGEKIGYYGKVDFQTDATVASLKDKSVGAVFASGLPRDIRLATIKEAARVLIDNGFLIWQHGMIEDFDYAKANNFKVMQFLRPKREEDPIVYHIIFKKEMPSPDG